MWEEDISVLGDGGNFGERLWYIMVWGVHKVFHMETSELEVCRELEEASRCVEPVTTGVSPRC